ncbi:SMI1/KNR4 family protein [Muribacter muris]|uniref:SMI1/KNR4 family protein n=1 Tax=Muribacter muris TaxID=67855 RepID=A0A4Y9K0F8_9PAST|nr:SMI1/KNR4 family protein [Muribacter muris]MBF0785083.1 SMI1/KNR4 family protein [Muribacter muris]MBF0826903.1 SMI1/KNR4 family protein [Muribacter muris]TFV10176.1 SMI1/KNR4 family protein [Muribacter muris]
MKKFRYLDIDDEYASKVSQEIISEFESIFNIKLPSLYVEFITEYNKASVRQDTFDYYDSYNQEEALVGFGFDSFETEENIEPGNNILRQWIYDDEIYGYPYVYSFGSTGAGDFICFDYRDNPLGDNPKICIVIHDEYDEQTGRRLLFPVADDFEEFLDKLYDFNERYPEGYSSALFQAKFCKK